MSLDASSGAAGLESYKVEKSARLATWPLDGGYRGVFPGQTAINLVKGIVTFPPNLHGPVTDSIQSRVQLGIEKYKSAVLFLDQPCRVKFDNAPHWIAFEQGVHELHFDIFNSILIENYTPMAAAVILAPTDRSPINVASAKMPFKRYGSWTAITDAAFAAVPMFPLHYTPGYNPNYLGQPVREDVLLLKAGASLAEEAGCPVISNVSDLILSVRNYTSDKNFFVKAQAKGRDSDSGVDWQNFETLTGTRGTLVRLNCEAKFEIGGGKYYKMKILKCSLDATTSSGRVELNGMIGGGA